MVTARKSAPPRRKAGMHAAAAEPLASSLPITPAGPSMLVSLARQLQTWSGSILGGVGTATDKTTVPSKISAIKLTIGAKSIDNNFGEIGDSPDMLVSKSSNTVKFTVNNVARYSAA